METNWLTRAEAAARLSVSLETVDRYARRGRLQRHYIAGTRSVRFKSQDVESLLAPTNKENEK